MTTDEALRVTDAAKEIVSKHVADALAAEVRRLRQRHAADVEAAFKDGWLERGLLPDCGMPPLHSCDAAWLQSDARRKCAALTII